MRKAFLGALAAVMAGGLLIGPAEAGRRHQRHYYDSYYAGPIYVPAPPFLGLFFGPPGPPPGDMDEDPEGRFDESYYDPSYVVPKAKPKPAVKSVTVTKPVSAAATSALSCTKASGIVGGYGFTAVKASNCKGPVYGFNAVRDGKKYAVKLNATSGELTEVRKVE